MTALEYQTFLRGYFPILGYLINGISEMKNERRNTIRILAPCIVAILPISMSLPAYAGSCSGTVRGLSSTYNANTGSGFLAVRSGRSSKSRKVGELFNGQEVQLYPKKGNWYEVDGGWAFAKYIRTSCDPNNP